eukprot:GHVS01001347.1.p1 GENE.GHVS01001347.1~~GHVS01001347.1.p1  ORF type:complete len:186 (+),score=22.62 GHVS01001347.1:692-1249(+)
MKDAVDAKVFRWSLSRAAEDPEASTETWGYLLPPDPQPTQTSKVALPAQTTEVIRVVVPDLPRLQDLQANENEIPDDEKRWLVQVPEGTWHHVQTHRLWIPPAWREAICRKSLPTPLALPPVSIDFVCPRRVGVASWWYVVILDHCTRFASFYSPGYPSSERLISSSSTGIRSSPPPSRIGPELN